ncbi:alpha-1,2-mannosyltransferase alg11 [Pavlovales sp. CCMP2436]|nr:alpha-1,2-mannosyltransferase alg11 [Pavlovales sp. CCMP2436]
MAEHSWCVLCLGLVPGCLVSTLLLGLRACAACYREEYVLAFFHPYCNDGGGGERVLWCAIAALQREHPRLSIAVYTGDAPSGEAIIARVRERFGIALPRPVRFVKLRSRWLIDASSYPRFTMLGQFLGGAFVAVEALCRLTPSVFVDTMGCACAYPVARGLFGCHVACYVHYPTISTEMIKAVGARRAEHNNDATIAASRWRTAVKLCYYCAFAALYALAGRFATVVLANSTWTAGHIRQLWDARGVRVLFPPCDTTALAELPLCPLEREQLVISIAQFRPEKAHAQQLRAFARLRERWPAEHADARLVIIGSVRDAGDARRVAELRTLSTELGLDGCVLIATDVSYAERLGWLARAAVGLHTMWMEHFGIGIVELMASGVVPVAHASGGPLADIVVPVRGRPSGRLASSADEYAEAMHELLALAKEPGARVAYAQLQRSAREAAARFSDDIFAEGFARALRPLFGAP